MTPVVSLNCLEPATFPSTRGRYEVLVNSRRYCTVRCSPQQATRLVRAIRTDIALPALAKALNATRRTQP